MPLHDWTRVPSGLFHDFHQSWSIRIKDSLNAGRLPKGISALVEQRIGVRETDVLAVETRSRTPFDGSGNGGPVGILERPATSIMTRSDKGSYAARANRIVVRHHLGRIIAVIEIVSPGNKDSRIAMREFHEKAIAVLQQNVPMLVVDLVPPTPRDPLGIHKLIWDEFAEEPFVFPRGKDRILAAYEMGADRAAYVEPIGVGDALPDMPLFLASGLHVRVPLESTYGSTWDATPVELRTAVESGVMPDPDAD